MDGMMSIRHSWHSVLVLRMCQQSLALQAFSENIDAKSCAKPRLRCRVHMEFPMQIRVVLTLALSAICFPTGAFALDQPTGEVVLTVSAHQLGHPNINGTAQFDLPMLEALAGRTAEMETPWTEGKVKFSGPLLRSILEAAGARGSQLKVIALNDYSANVPMEDAAQIDTILATRMNGNTMSVRDKGPLFLIYPFDKDASLFNEKYFSRSVWQIKTIEVSE